MSRSDSTFSQFAINLTVSCSLPILCMSPVPFPVIGFTAPFFSPPVYHCRQYSQRRLLDQRVNQLFKGSSNRPFGKWIDRLPGFNQRFGSFPESCRTFKIPSVFNGKAGVGVCVKRKQRGALSAHLFREVTWPVSERLSRCHLATSWSPVTRGFHGTGSGSDPRIGSGSLHGIRSTGRGFSRAGRTRHHSEPGDSWL